MKEFLNGCCSIGTYKTPWCQLLSKELGCGCGDSMLHLWYKLDFLQAEIDKRSAYLGKFRRTEEAKHLLDLINMTTDESNLFIPFARAAMADVFDALNLYTPHCKKAYFWNEGTTTIVINEDGECNEGGNYISFKEGNYVLYKGELYIAVADGDSNNLSDKIKPTEDYRKSIHYGIKWTCCESNINMVEPLDTAIFEALVARIIYKWLLYAYPDEAPHYLQEYVETLQNIKTRVNFLNGTHIVNRIPRLF